MNRVGWPSRLLASIESAGLPASVPCFANLQSSICNLKCPEVSLAEPKTPRSQVSHFTLELVPVRVSPETHLPRAMPPRARGRLVGRPEIVGDGLRIDPDLCQGRQTRAARSRVVIV